MTEINSKNNSKIKDLIKLRDDSKFRNDKSLFYVEGERIISDSPKELIDSIYIQKSKLENFKRIINRYNDSQIFLIDDDIFNKIKDTINSQGIIAVVKYNCIKNLSNNYLENIQNCLLLDNVNDPGNLGTIIRLAEATNISLIILCNSCCNLYNPKVIRSCMSSLFRVNIYISDDISNDIKFFKNNNFKIYATVLDNESKHFNSIYYNSKSVFIFGNEANGISKSLIDTSDEKIFIPMCGRIQSLNVAIAATAICYELMRQNNYYET